jgi:coproporphyrinogen III oxidase-like Fe-S oxidoreductase
MLPAIEVETLSEHRRAGELAMLMLRLARGINFADFSARTGMDARALWSDQIERYVHAGLLRQDRLGFALTERGLVVADALAAEFLDPEPAFPIKPA